MATTTRQQLQDATAEAMACVFDDIAEGRQPTHRLVVLRGGELWLEAHLGWAGDAEREAVLQAVLAMLAAAGADAAALVVDVAVASTALGSDLSGDPRDDPRAVDAILAVSTLRSGEDQRLVMPYGRHDDGTVYLHSAASSPLPGSVAQPQMAESLAAGLRAGLRLGSDPDREVLSSTVDALAVHGVELVFGDALAAFLDPGRRA